MNIGTYKLGARLDSLNYLEAQDALIAIIEKGGSTVIDMTDCHYVSSAGLRVLLLAKKTTAAQGIKLYLVGVNAEVKDVMDVTGFTSFFDIYETMEDCMKAIEASN